MEYRNLQVGLEIHSLPSRIRITSIATTIHEPFITHSNHVIRIKRLDISAGLCRPLGDNTRGTPITSRFIRELPGKNRGAACVPRDNRFDVSLVLSLDPRIRVPGGFRSAVVRVVCRHAAVITPVVDKVDNQFYAVCSGTGYYIVEALEPI